MREYIEYMLLKSFFFLAKWMPKSFIYSSSKALALLLFWIDRKRRNIAITNLQDVFSLSFQEAKEMALKNYIELSFTVSEILLLMTERFYWKSIDVSGLEKLKNYPKPFIFITAHIGNWEVLAQLLAKNGYPMGVVGRKGDNELIEQNFTLPFRNRYGNSLIYKHQAARSLMRYLKEGKNVGLLLDQRAGRDGLWVEFFGKKASTIPTVYTLQKRFLSSVIPIFLVRVDGKLKLEIFDPIEFIDDAKEHTKAINKVYEKIIQKYPLQWFWMHDRWRK